ncbi:hypothetical protein JCM10049v2_001683 [Rhodotorula toruloides]
MPKCAVCQAESTQRRPTLADTYYCGAEHQKQHWPTHKPSCKAPAATATPSGAKPTAGRAEPRGKDERGGFKMNVHPVSGSPADLMSQLEPFAVNIPKQQVYERLIDAYRLWIDDCYVWRGENIGLYAQEDPYPEFVKFVKKARKHLPSWFKDEDEKAVLAMCRSHEWADINFAVEKQDINEHYGSTMMAMGLRMWTEKVTGKKLT